MVYILCACNNTPQAQKKTISFSGAFALYPLMQKWAQEYNKLHPGINFNIQAGGAGKGLTDVLSGAVDVGMFSREITDEEINKGIWWIVLCKEAVVPVINAKNPYRDMLLQKGLKKEDFKHIFVDHTPATWNSLLNISANKQDSINVYTRADVAGSAESWAAWFGMKQVNLTGKKIEGDSLLTEMVKNDPGAMAYSNSVFVFDHYSGEKYPGIEVVPIDVNGNNKLDEEENFYKDLSTFLEAVHNGNFPSPPARDLYFITSKRPIDHELLDFFEWVLTDGQKFLSTSGYVPLKPALLKDQVRKVSPIGDYEH